MTIWTVATEQTSTALTSGMEPIPYAITSITLQTRMTELCLEQALRPLMW